MSKNLLNYVKDQFSDNVISSIGSMIGENAGVTKTAMGAALPTLLKGIINRGDTPQNVSSLRKYVVDEGIGSNLLGSLGKDAFLSKGAGVVDFLFGSAKSTLLGNIGKLVGFGSGKTSSLVSALAPMVLSYVMKLGKSENYTDQQFANYLGGQKSNLANLGAAASSGSSASTGGDNGGGMGMLKWLLPLLLLAAALWWFMNKDKAVTETTDSDKTEMSSSRGVDKAEAHAGHDHSGHDHAGHDHADHDHSAHGNAVEQKVDNIKDGATELVNEGKDAMKDAADGVATFTIDAKGNLIDAKGNLIAKAGEFTEKDGAYLDKDGKKIGFFKKVGKAVGDAGKAVGGAAVKTADAMKKVFSGMFKSKEKVGSTYGLSQIEFDSESHKITNFSKGEVEGLAAALKDMPDAKIQVQVHGASNKVTDLRANVIRDMLVTLGVGKKQIKAKGMGEGNGEKVEIKVEQTVD